MLYIQDMKRFLFGVVLSVMAFGVHAQYPNVPGNSTPQAQSSGPDFTELYMLNEIKDLRIKAETLEKNVTQTLTDQELRVSDRALSYTSNAVTFFSFFLTLTLGLFALFGWRTIKDIKQSARGIVEESAEKLLSEFRTRLENLESDLKEKGATILKNQEELERVQRINTLWTQVNRTKDDRKKLEILEALRALDEENPELWVSKSSSYLRLDLPEKALEACSKALEIQSENPTAVYNSACAHAQLGEEKEALSQLHYAIKLSEHFRDMAQDDRDFAVLKKKKAFKELIKS